MSRTRTESQPSKAAKSRTRKGQVWSEAVDHFVEAMQSLPEVQAVFVQEISSDHARIWTVISAPPHEPQYRYQVYEAQREILSGLDRPAVEFRLVNQQELEDDLDTVLPATRRLAFAR